MPRPRRLLKTQTLKYEDINFLNLLKKEAPAPTITNRQRGRPIGTAEPAPYWEFDWKLDPASGGLVLTNLVVIGSDPIVPNGSAPVAEQIDFTDLKLAFSDTAANTLEVFPVASAFSHSESNFEFVNNGTNFKLQHYDPLYQYGMMLTLVHEFGGTCKVTLRLSIVFRGSTNDFDPGGIPVHLNFYPQIGWTWQPVGSGGRRVRRFRGSVRITVNNETPKTEYEPASGGLPAIPEMEAMHENIANCFADSNVSKEPGNGRCEVMLKGNTADLYAPNQVPIPIPVFPYFKMVPGRDLRDLALVLGPFPFGWGQVFDYMLMNIQDEIEYVAVYGPEDEPFYSLWRNGAYKWPASGPNFIRDYKVGKAPRQGFYDNVHLHGKMHMPIKGKEQIHAPFCGHSCVHMHWRWSGVAGNTAPSERAWYYKGWSTGKTIEGNVTDHSALIPPNQKLTVALCRPGHSRSIVAGKDDDAHILPSTGRGTLDPLRKLIWYCADVIHTDAVPINVNEQQVIMEAGLGWAYRYALPADKTSGLYGPIGLFTAFNGSPKEPYSQARIMEFFEQKVYPGFRFYDDGTIQSDQVPQGTYKEEMTGPGKSLESL